MIAGPGVPGLLPQVRVQRKVELGSTLKPRPRKCTVPSYEMFEAAEVSCDTAEIYKHALEGTGHQYFWPIYGCEAWAWSAIDTMVGYCDCDNP